VRAGRKYHFVSATVLGTFSGISEGRDFDMSTGGKRAINLPAPYLRRLWLDPARIAARAAYPYCLPFLKGDFELRFERAITIIVGENGTGKSTLLEGIAALAGYDEAGGGKGYMPVDHSQAREDGRSAVAGVPCELAAEDHPWLVLPSGKFLLRTSVSSS
jgi:AAA domain